LKFVSRLLHFFITLFSWKSANFEFN
jgi:hypothetical protein